MQTPQRADSTDLPGIKNINVSYDFKSIPISFDIGTAIHIHNLDEQFEISASIIDGQSIINIRRELGTLKVENTLVPSVATIKPFSIIKSGSNQYLLVSLSDKSYLIPFDENV